MRRLAAVEARLASEVASEGRSDGLAGVVVGVLRVSNGAHGLAQIVWPTRCSELLDSRICLDFAVTLVDAVRTLATTSAKPYGGYQFAPGVQTLSDEERLRARIPTTLSQDANVRVGA